MIDGPLKWPGGKSYLAPHIHAKAAQVSYTHRVIGYAGGLGEFWNWPCEGISEVVNDIDLSLTNFYWCLQDKEHHLEMIRRLSVTPFSKEEFDAAELCTEWQDTEKENPCLPAAIAFFTRVRMSMMGMRETFTPLTKKRTRGGRNAEVNAWMNCIPGLLDVHERLIRPVIYNVPAVQLLKQEDGPQTLFYYDPPYYHGSRVSKKLYKHEMTHEQHCELLEALFSVKGKWILSAYANELYESVLGCFNCQAIEIDNKMSTQSEKPQKIELLYSNF